MLEIWSWLDRFHVKNAEQNTKKSGDSTKIKPQRGWNIEDSLEIMEIFYHAFMTKISWK